MTTPESKSIEAPELPETIYNACGDGSEPLYTPEMVMDYARAYGQACILADRATRAAPVQSAGEDETFRRKQLAVTNEILHGDEHSAHRAWKSLIAHIDSPLDAARGVGGVAKTPYLLDMEDTLSQIGALVGVQDDADKLIKKVEQLVSTCPRGCTSPEQGGSGCMAVTGDCADAAPSVPEGYVLALQAAVKMPDGKHELGYTLLDGVGIFTSQQEVFDAIAELSLPLGWVGMTTSQLLPGWMLPEPPAASPLPEAAKAEPPHDLNDRDLQVIGRTITGLRDGWASKADVGHAIEIIGKERARIQALSYKAEPVGMPDMSDDMLTPEQLRRQVKARIAERAAQAEPVSTAGAVGRPVFFVQGKNLVEHSVWSEISESAIRSYDAGIFTVRTLYSAPAAPLAVTAPTQSKQRGYLFVGVDGHETYFKGERKHEMEPRLYACGVRYVDVFDGPAVTAPDMSAVELQDALSAARMEAYPTTDSPHGSVRTALFHNHVAFEKGWRAAIQTLRSQPKGEAQ